MSIQAIGNADAELPVWLYWLRWFGILLRFRPFSFVYVSTSLSGNETKTDNIQEKIPIQTR